MFSSRARVGHGQPTKGKHSRPHWLSSVPVGLHTWSSPSLCCMLVAVVVMVMVMVVVVFGVVVVVVVVVVCFVVCMIWCHKQVAYVVLPKLQFCRCPWHCLGILVCVRERVAHAPVK
jgi:hypothetical protein